MSSFSYQVAVGKMMSEIETGTGQTEVERHHQIQLAFKTVVLPVDFFRLHAVAAAPEFSP